jgi:hypothetical protein
MTVMATVTGAGHTAFVVSGRRPSLFSPKCPDTIRFVVNLGVAAMQLSARRWLHALHHELGAAGLAAAATLPGLVAVLDQHIAAVREATTTGMKHSATLAGAVLLAHYGRGVLAEAHRHGWQSPQLTGWCRADWTSMRLVAVSALAHDPTPLTDLPPWPHSPAI